MISLTFEERTALAMLCKLQEYLYHLFEQTQTRGITRDSLYLRDYRGAIVI